MLVAYVLATQGTASTTARVPASASAAERAWTLTLSPSPEEISLAQISFPASDTHRLAARALRALVEGPFGADYLALAAVRHAAAPGALRALVLLLNRPSPLLDPAFVHVRVSAYRALGMPATHTLENVFALASYCAAVFVAAFSPPASIAILVATALSYLTPTLPARHDGRGRRR